LVFADVARREIVWRYLRFRVRLSGFQPGVESGAGFCRFPVLGSTEAERLSGESRDLLPLGNFLQPTLLQFKASNRSMPVPRGAYRFWVAIAARFELWED